jgi:hypothetical protein
MSDEEIAALRKQRSEDRKLLQRAADALAQIDRSDGLNDENADVLAALRIRLEGKERASLEDLMSVTGDISGKKDLKDILSTPQESSTAEWPVVEEKKKDWPGL